MGTPLPNLSALSLAVSSAVSAKRPRPPDAEDAPETETLVVDFLSPYSPLPKGMGIGGALPPLPIKDVVEKTMVCAAHKKELVVPTATLMPVGPLGRKTLMYHSSINPCQPHHKGSDGDLGRVKWYALEPTMSFNFALEASSDPETVKVANAAAEAAGCLGDAPANTKNAIMDVYELVRPVENLMLFNDMRVGKWSDMGGQMSVLEGRCIPTIPTGTSADAPAIDPTVDPRSPGHELSFAKLMHTYPFGDGTTPNGWIRLNNAFPLLRETYPNTQAQMLVEMGYEVMLSLESHETHLRHVKRVELKSRFASRAYDVDLRPVEGVSAT